MHISMIDVTVKVEEARLAEFYAMYAEWLKSGSEGERKAEGVLAEWAADDIQQARHVWTNMHEKARTLFEILLAADAPVPGVDLARALGPDAPGRHGLRNLRAPRKAREGSGPKEHDRVSSLPQRQLLLARDGRQDGVRAGDERLSLDSGCRALRREAAPDHALSDPLVTVTDVTDAGRSTPERGSPLEPRGAPPGRRPVMDLNARLRFDHELLAVEHEHDVSCMLELTAPAAPATHARRPLALALVIDRSGSMQGEKLDVTRRCAAFLVEHLAPTDRLAIVSFDDQITLDAPLTEVGPHRPQLQAAIRGIHAGGQTNLSGGWLKGVETLSPLDEGTHTRRILLLTDGQANVGITDDHNWPPWRAPRPPTASAPPPSGSARASARTCWPGWPTPAVAAPTSRPRPTPRRTSSRRSSRTCSPWWRRT